MLLSVVEFLPRYSAFDDAASTTASLNVPSYSTGLLILHILAGSELLGES